MSLKAENFVAAVHQAYRTRHDTPRKELAYCKFKRCLTVTNEICITHRCYGAGLLWLVQYQFSAQLHLLHKLSLANLFLCLKYRNVSRDFTRD